MKSKYSSKNGKRVLKNKEETDSCYYRDDKKYDVEGDYEECECEEYESNDTSKEDTENEDFTDDTIKLKLGMWVYLLKLRNPKFIFII